MTSKPQTEPSSGLARFLRRETTGGLLLFGAAALALLLANTPLREAYGDVRSFAFGPEALHLHLDVAAWTADGLLALFFFVAGAEVKRELVVGELADRKAAALPIIAAVAGMVVPAAVFLAVAAGAPGADRGWAIPVATDIAFALGALALVARSLPSGVRVLLLSLAVVDDIIAIALIALLFTSDASGLPLLGAGVGLAAFALMQRARVTAWWAYVPVALAVWGLTHASGVHATVAGVLLGLAMRVRRDEGEERSPAERMEELLQPFSAGLAVPLFALFSVGIEVSPSMIGDAASNRAAVAVVVGLVVGKVVGVAGGTWLAVRLGLGRLPEGLTWTHVVTVGLLAGCGFTVSLLVTELAFAEEPLQSQVKAAVLAGSLLAAGAATVLAAWSQHRATRGALARVREREVPPK